MSKPETNHLTTRNYSMADVAAKPVTRRRALAEIDAQTGVEMEALCGLNIALLTIRDLTKPVNAALKISNVRLLAKTGGKRGNRIHPDGLSTIAQSILDAD